MKHFSVAPAALLAYFFGAIRLQMVVITIGFAATLPWLMRSAPAMLVAFPITAGVPFAMHHLLHSVKEGWLVSEDKRRANKHSFDVTLLVLFNIFETTTQAMLFITLGIVLGQVDTNLTPVGPVSSWLPRVLWQVPYMLFSADVGNYLFHRLSHENKFLYTYMHSIHHEQKQVNHAVWALFYVHPIETLIVNCFFFGNMIAVKTDIFTIAIYGCISASYVGAGHSGLKLPAWLDKFLDTSFHQLHHSMNHCNYCEHFTWLDRFFGTYVAPPPEETCQGKGCMAAMVAEAAASAFDAVSASSDQYDSEDELQRRESRVSCSNELALGSA